MFTRASAIFLIAIASSASAQGRGFFNGNKLHDFCNGQPHDVVEWGFCSGYTMGVVDILINGDAVAGFQACIPEGSNVSQISDVVSQWLRENPENRHYVAAGLVAWAASEAFPCH